MIYVFILYLLPFSLVSSLSSITVNSPSSIHADNFLVGPFSFSGDFTNVTGILIQADPISACQAKDFKDSDKYFGKFVLVDGTLLGNISCRLHT
jgi:hypothetical protein